MGLRYSKLYRATVGDQPDFLMRERFFTRLSNLLGETDKSDWITEEAPTLNVDTDDRGHSVMSVTLAGKQYRIGFYEPISFCEAKLANGTDVVIASNSADTTGTSAYVITREAYQSGIGNLKKEHMYVSEESARNMIIRQWNKWYMNWYRKWISYRKDVDKMLDDEDFDEDSFYDIVLRAR